MKRVYGTWHDPRTGLRHYASGVPNLKQWDTYLLCGGYIVTMPTKPRALVTCVRCLWKWLQSRDPRSLLRGQRADLVVIDEAQDFNLAKLALLSARRPSP